MTREKKISAGKMRVRLYVSFSVPVGADRDDCQEYVLAAVKGWCGGMDPDHPFTDLQRESVVVARNSGRTGRHDTSRRLR